MVERNPWWKNVSGPFPKWEGPLGCKADGGGCHYGRGTVGKMTIHRAVCNHDKEGEDLANRRQTMPILINQLEQYISISGRVLE
jgi:hypothetical protein